MADGVRSIDEIPSLTLLYKLSRLSPLEPDELDPESDADANADADDADTTIPPAPSARLNDTICLIRTDITKLGVSAIVNAANSSLLGGGGVDGVIHARAGPGLLEECEALDGCPTGSAKITGAYELPCDKVIHAVGPRYGPSRRQRPGLEKERLRGCYVTSLDLARDNACKSIAFSCISTGVYGYPSDEAAEVVCQTLREWLLEHEEDHGGLEKIVICCFERKDEAAYEAALPKYFPPVPEDKPSTATESESLKDRLPDAPTSEPVEPGQPSTKKQKIAPSDADDEWEKVDGTGQSAINGLDEIDDDGERSTSKDEDVILQEKKEEQAAALHTAQIGGDPPRSDLEKDW